MKCNKCGAKIDKKDNICPSCGEKVEKIGYFNFIKRREQRYIETQELLSKSYINSDEAKTSVLKEAGGISVEYKGEYAKIMRSSILKAVLFALLLIGSVAVISIRQYTHLMDGVDKVGMTVILLIAFLLIFGSLAAAYDIIYFAVRCRKMKAKGEDIAKINFGKEPTAYYAGKLYKVGLKINCPMCAQSGAMHIEQVDNMLVAVCGYDRSHMMRISYAEALNAVKEYELGRSGLQYTPTVDDTEADKPESTAEDKNANSVDAEVQPTQESVADKEEKA